MQKLFSIFSLVLLYAVMAFGQAAIDIPITVENNVGDSKVLNFGLDLTATDGIDILLGEGDLPPAAFAFDARQLIPPFAGALSSWKDYRNAPVFPFTGQKEHRLKYQTGDGGGTTINIIWNLPAGVTGVLKDIITGTLINVPMSGSGNYTVTDPAAFAQLKMIIDYDEVGPASPGPIFSMSPSSLPFGTVGVGGSGMLPVTVSNPGTTNALTIDSAVSSNPEFTFLPNSFPMIINTAGNQVFNVTFAPTDDGLENDSITFYHNGLGGSPTSLSLSGTGQTQGGLLKFSLPSQDVLDGSVGNPDTIVLSGYSGQPLKALQFNLLIGKTNGKLILRSISRGAAIPAGLFNFSYEIYPGAFLPDGSSVDTVKVVILGNGTNAILPNAGNQEIMRFSFDVVSISGVSAQTFNGLAGVLGATTTPVINANISTGPDEIIYIWNGVIGVGLLGDVNLDDQVDLLDILLMIDYILGRVTFNAQQFYQGDIAPWTIGAPLPTPDGVINVLDLAVLQNIVLTGIYPSGTPVYKIAAGSSQFTMTNMNKLTP